jgi:hypothetical protein
MTSKTTNKYAPEARDRAVRMVLVLSDQSQLVFVWRTKAKSGQPQAASDCHPANAAERRILYV